LGLHPGLSQGWDLIPFSFVVDWFCSIGPNLDLVDDCLYKNRYGLEYILYSDRHSAVVQLESLFNTSVHRLVGELECVVYTRKLDINFPDPVFNFDMVDPSNWIVAGASLMLANRRH